MPAKDVKAYIKRNKNDAADAEAICEAVRRPDHAFCAGEVCRSAGPPDAASRPGSSDAAAHAADNAIRSHLAELGIIAPQGREGIKELLAIIANDDNQHLPVDARASLIVLAAQLQALQTMIGGD